MKEIRSAVPEMHLALVLYMISPGANVNTNQTRFDHLGGGRGWQCGETARCGVFHGEVRGALWRAVKFGASKRDQGPNK